MNLYDVCPGLPRMRRECPSGPCHHVACRYHLWTERCLDRQGGVVDLRETAAWGDPEHTCTLREAERGPKTLQEIGRILDLSRERVRQIEAEVLERLRVTDTGELRETLEAVKEMACEGELWEGDDSAQPEAQGTDESEAEEPAADDTGVPEGADEPVMDDTSRLPWSEPTYTGEEHTEAYKAALRRLRRASEKAPASQPYWCPYCGRTYPGVSLHRGGKERHGCPKPRCAARAWAARAREQGRHRLEVEHEVIAAIRAEYRPGERGYRALAREHGLPVGTVAKIVRGDRRREG